MQSAQTSKDDLPCLLNAYKKLKKEMEKKDDSSYKKLYQTVFDELKDILNQRYWFADDKDQPSTQSELIEKAKNIYLKSLNITYKKLLAIRKSILGKSIIDDEERLKILKDPTLKFVLTSIAHAMADLAKGRKTGDKAQPLKLNKNEEEYYSAYYLTQYLSNQLGGSYIPHRQSDDPLVLNRIINEKRGVCSGDLETWVLNVSSKENPFIGVRANDQVMDRQIQSKTLFREYRKCLMAKSYRSTMDVWLIIQDMIEKLEKNYFYGFTFVPPIHLKKRGHVMGFYLTSDGGMLFRDSNDVTVSFKDVATARKFIFYYFIDYYKAGFFDESYNEGTIDLIQWKPLAVSVAVNIPKIQNDKKYTIQLKSMKDEEHTMQGFELLHSQLQIISLLPKDDKIPEVIYKTFEAENNSFNNSLQKEFKLTDKKENKSNFVEYMNNYHQKLKNATLKTLNQQIKNIIQFQEKNKTGEQNPRIDNTLKLLQQIRGDVEKAEIDKTLISIVDHHLGERVAPKSVRDLVKKHEIHPGCALILQQKLLRQLCVLCNIDWTPVMVSGEREGEDSKKLPASIKHVRKLLQDYYMYDMIDMPGLLSQIQLVFAEKGSGFFSRVRHMRTAAMQEFDAIIKSLEVHNPSSLQEAFFKITEFAEAHLKPIVKKQPEPMVSSSPLLSVA